MRYVVKKQPALSRWPYVAAGRQPLEAVEREAEEGTTEQLMEVLRSATNASAEEPHHRQFYPPGRIMHMVALPASEEQEGQNARVALYETPRGTYGKIRLARSMIKDHYMPSYVETMEMLIDKLAEDDAPLSNTDDVPLD
jgi:hypothetical protein